MKKQNKFKKSLPCGAWPSPLTSTDATGSSVSLHDMNVDGKTLYWLESRPSEKGRTALVCRRPSGVVEDITLPPVNVASRVHEYGGGSYAVDSERVIYTEKTDGSVWLIKNEGAPRKITNVKDCRYADFKFIPGTDNVVCVREDHRGRPASDPETTIVILKTESSLDSSKNEGDVVVKGPDFLSSPRPSPDGKKLAWLSWNHPDMPWDSTQLNLATLNVDNIKDVSIVAGDKNREAIVQPEWSPDGRLHFCSDRNNWWNIYCQENNNIKAVSKITDGEIGGPHWVFGQRYYDFAPDNSLVAVLSRNNIRQAVKISNDGDLVKLNIPNVSGCPSFLKREDGSVDLSYIRSDSDAMPYIGVTSKGANKVIRKSGSEIIGKEHISVPKEITFPTSKGEKSYAFFYPPTNGDYKPEDDEKPPLIVMIHGGPTSCATSNFSPLTQWWTSRGFAVVDVNYRGSTGYGRSYRQKLDHNWGVADVEDCTAVVNYLSKEGLIDPKRTAIRGGSAGGFTVLASLTSSDVFKAGASHYGVADLMLLAQETHKFESRYLDRLIGPLPQAKQVYKDRSPINHLSKLNAGVIFFQGLDDKVVPPSQAANMVKAMRNKNIPVAHYEFPGEAHGFRQAETKRKVLELELSFYGKMFGFTPPGLSEMVKLDYKGGNSKHGKASPS